MRRVRPGLVWGTLLSVGAAYELWGLTGDREGYTLSETTRRWFHTDSPTGRCLFVGAFLGFSGWFVPHIFAVAEVAMSSFEDMAAVSSFEDIPV
jgi:hypothetical protein